ncbi:G1 family glutamic endopeptidase [Granulicella tundricola]|uniref:Peptidase A4 family protein n=1 Tax=Granulicella tundricola (strain ATCC BAA-1859 / DSM 23138 / MP5ACTX9) TaxID=1198114 RepID=E8WYF8_GRATM|nr:G1 family glutamic endopeptidase [Granulicella tundricola]ADW69864.1 hypothetical protein AciX9_2841 [Granulicella tundricola MP5ACTX9]
MSDTVKVNIPQTPVATPVPITPQPGKFILDQGAFLQKLPFQAHPTPLPGVFTVPAPPSTLILATASQSDLIKAGIMFRQPTAQDPPGVQAAWKAFTSQHFDPAKRIIPEMAPQVGVTHNLKTPPTQVSNTSYNGTVWSGAGTKTGTWTTCIGTWVIPTVSKPSEAQGTEGGWNSSSWVGLDGFFYTNDVLQAGIQQHVNAAGVANYVAWYEWYAPIQAGSPSYVYQTNITNFPVSPGQTVSCSVQYVANHAGSISFSNQTTGQHFTITLAPPPGATNSGGSCEWIMEAPDGGEPKSSLPKFTPVVFTTALACGPNNTSTNPATGDTLNITTSSGKVLTKVTTGSDTCTISFIG